MLSKLINIFFPDICLLCRQDGSLLCLPCSSSISHLANQECPYCRKQSPQGYTCVDCKSNGACLDFLYVATTYRAKSSIARVIKGMKYSSYSRIITLIPPSLFTIPTSLFFQKNSILVPVPLHKSKQRVRGFNQAQLIAQRVHAINNIPLQSCISRTRATTSQASLNKVQRHQNLLDAFTYLPEPSKVIILVDDVATTLSTLEACAKSIEIKSPKYIGAFALARGNMSN